MKKFYLFIAALLASLAVYSQVAAPRIDVYAGGTAAAGGSKPFWQVANQHGKYALAPFEGMAGLKVEGVDSSGSWISFDYGLELYDRFGTENNLVLHQGYAEIKTPLLTFRAGRKEEMIGNQDSTLSTGGSVWSGNARPMPKLVLATPGYVDVPFTKGYVEVNGSLAHGWFEKERYVEDVYMHQKHAHIRFGGDSRLNVSLGLIHFAHWGGVSSNEQIGALPSDLDAYKRVFLAQSAPANTSHTGEILNALGNHLGARNYRIDYKGKGFSVGFYFQTIFEDNSGMSKLFYEDGVKGLVIRTHDKERLVNHLLVEYIQTTWQSGPVHDLSGPIKLKGNDNYFNNYIYRSGWSYLGMTLGTPLITSPLYNEEAQIGMTNTRVKGYHLGWGGVVRGLNYRTMFTYSVNK
ncbi:capsule assembly Wzi family protein, partial [Candidatus Electrothrix sp.]|uniref:capsule assembly Wzi family protein n=1 Tax=Candidatus Electrothrix sp. TaxID=2170559 RepID=UPI004055F006